MEIEEDIEEDRERKEGRGMAVSQDASRTDASHCLNYHLLSFKRICMKERRIK